jgi:hypothetical protein
MPTRRNAWLIGMLAACQPGTQAPPQPPAPIVEAPVAVAASPAWLEGRLVLTEITLQGYAPEIAADIDAAAALNLEATTRCLAPLTTQLPTSCATLTLHWSREQPLHADGRHYADDSVRLTLEGVQDQQVIGCLEVLRDSWRWAARTEPMPPAFGFILHLKLADSAATIKGCTSGSDRREPPR